MIHIFQRGLHLQYLYPKHPWALHWPSECYLNEVARGVAPTYPRARFTPPGRDWVDDCVRLDAPETADSAIQKEASSTSGMSTIHVAIIGRSGVVLCLRG
jgi:hypothetical protein